MPPQDAFSDLSLDQAGALGASSPAAVPPISFFDKVRLGFKRGENAPDWGFNELDKGVHAYQEIYEELRKRGYKLTEEPDFHGFWNIGQREARGERIDPRKMAFPWQLDEYQALWRAFADARSRDPKFLPQYADAHDGGTLIAHLRQGMNEALEDVDRQAPNGLGFAGFIGELGHGARDPLNYVGDGLGASAKATTILGKVASAGGRNAALNMGITAATEPLVRRSSEERGLERTTGDFLIDLGVAGTAGLVLGGAGEAVPGTIDAVRDRRRAATAAVEPPAVEAPQASAPGQAERPATTMAQTFAETVPPEQRTPAEQAALHVIEREEEVRSTSPFVEGPVGDDEHVAWLDVGLRALNGEGPMPGAKTRPVAREAIANGTADPSVTRSPPRAALKARIHQAEAPNGGYNLLGSGALGPYQFMPQTWVTLFRRRYPNDKRSFEQIAALRSDPALNEVLIDDLINENATALRHAGLPETASNLYLAHVLGYDRAITVLKAAPDARLGALLPHGYFDKNPFKADWSAAKLAAWSDRRMGGDGSRAIAAASDAGEKIDIAAVDLPDVPHPETGRYDVEAMLGIAGDDRPILKPELFASPEEHAAGQLRFEAARDAAEGYAAVRSADQLFSPGEHFEALRNYRGTVTLDAMAKELGITPDQVRRAVQSMQAFDRDAPFIFTAGGKTKTRVVDGRVESYNTEPRLMRRPPRPDERNTGPQSLLEFIAARGGINDVGGDLRSMGANEWHKAKKFRGRLIRENGEGIDDAFMAAWEAGFFPELGEAASRKPDLQLFRDAIDDELRGQARYRSEDFAAVETAAREAREPEFPGERPTMLWRDYQGERPEIADAINQAADRRGIWSLVDDDLLLEAADLVELHGLDPDEALGSAMRTSFYRDLDEFAATSGEKGYGFDDDGRRFDEDPGLPEQRGDGAAFEAVPDGGGRPAPDAFAEEAGGVAAAAVADAPAEERFSDPVGQHAQAQADSIEHDLRMEAAPKEAPEGEAAPEPDTATYRLDADGDESDLGSILDEIDAAQKAAAEMRACMAPPKPKGDGQ